VGSIDAVLAVAELVEMLKREYDAARADLFSDRFAIAAE
jgi:hypothetical protein